jgi:DNA-directed RNA polymerase subunit M
MKFCPKCGSTNIEWVLPQTWSKWECRDCGYTGVLIIEDGKLADELRKEYLKKKENIQD